MNIHEYQAKEILKKFNIPIQDGFVLDDISQADNILGKVESELGSSQFVVKAQIHAGGRGKGGGVKFSPTKSQQRKTSKTFLE